MKITRRYTKAGHSPYEGIDFESRIGAGTNYSSLRDEDEPLSGGGKSSVLMSFQPGGDCDAGAIKSGGTCLSAQQRVFTNLGPVTLKELAESGKEFITLSFDPPSNRYKAKKATARLAGQKRTVTVRTDKGKFSMAYDHPFRLPDGSAVRAEDLRVGMSLMACAVDTQHGHLRVGLRDGKKGKEFLHRLIATDVLDWDVEGLAVHHVDENKLNNDPSNLRLIHQSEHAHHHGTALAKAGTHIFQTQAFPKAGPANGMHATSEFWTDTERVSAYKEKQGDILVRSGRANEMQRESTIQRMLNLGYKLINSGAEIPTFESYLKARKSVVGRIYSISKLRRTIEEYFGGYDGYVQALATNNHRVIEVVQGEVEDVYNVEVVCPTKDDESPSSGHNFLIWSGTSVTGSGVVVFNTRRIA